MSEAKQVEKRLRAAIQAEGVKLTGGDAYLGGFFAASGMSVPVRVKDSYSGDTFDTHRNGKVTISVEVHCRTTWTRTRAEWSDKQIQEAAKLAVAAYHSDMSRAREDARARAAEKHLDGVLQDLGQWPDSAKAEAIGDAVRIDIERPSDELLRAIHKAVMSEVRP